MLAINVTLLSAQVSQMGMVNISPDATKSALGFASDSSSVPSFPHFLLHSVHSYPAGNTFNDESTTDKTQCASLSE